MAEVVTVAQAAKKFKVSTDAVYGALRPLVRTGQIKPLAAMVSGRPCRMLDEKAMALLRKALKTGTPPAQAGKEE